MGCCSWLLVTAVFPLNVESLFSCGDRGTLVDVCVLNGGGRLVVLTVGTTRMRQTRQSRKLMAMCLR